MQIQRKVEQPIMLPIKKIIEDNKDFKTFVFSGQLGAKPGQFIMLWLPRVNMKPFSISNQTKDEFHITVMKVGEFTAKLFDLKVGELLGIQGPYGRPFSYNEGKNVAIVGGGCGIAPVNFLIYDAISKGKKVYFIGGCRNKDLFIKADEIKSLPVHTSFVTDDGSYGEKGFTTDALRKLLDKEKIDQIFACGPEKMLVAIGKIALERGIPCQISMERYMKCGFGVCGQCCVDDTGLRVCHEGPVFEAKTLLDSKEFGAYKRDGSGTKQKI